MTREEKNAAWYAARKKEKVTWEAFDMAAGAEAGRMEPQTIGDAVIILRAYQYGIRDDATEKGRPMHSFDLTNKTVELLLQGLKEGGYDV